MATRTAPAQVPCLLFYYFHPQSDGSPKNRAFSVLRGKIFGDERSPELPSRTELGHLHVQVHADAEEEGEAWGKFVHVQARLLGGPNVLDTVGDGKGQFQLSVGPSLLHVVSRDGNRVVFRHEVGSVPKNVRDDAHGGGRRINVRVPDHELLENIILDSALQLLQLHALLLGGHDVKGQD